MQTNERFIGVTSNDFYSYCLSVPIKTIILVSNVQATIFRTLKSLPKLRCLTILRAGNYIKQLNVLFKTNIVVSVLANAYSYKTREFVQEMKTR